MSVGSLFLVLALVLFFFAAVGVTVIPNPTAWGLVALTLGLLLAGIPLAWRRAGA
jgi:hypothetical protein